MKEKKLLIFIYTLGMGGAERMLSLLSKYIPEPYNATFAVHSVSAITFEHKGNIINFDLPRFKNSLLKYTYAIFRNIQVILTEKPQIIVSSLQFMDLLVLLSIAILRVLFFKVPKVIVRIESAREVKRPTSISLHLLGFLFRYVDHFIVVSQKLILPLSTNFSIPTSKISCIYNGVELTTTTLTPYPERRFEYDIISIGRMVEAKDHSTMLHALKLVIANPDMKNLSVCIVGGGDKEETSRALSHHLGLDENVTFTGTLDSSTAQLLLCKAKLFLLTSKWEGFGIVLIEAMSKAVPIVSTNCDFGPSEVLDNGKYGILIPVGDVTAIAQAVCELLRDEKNRIFLSKTSLQRASFFGIEKIAEQHKVLFDRLTEKS